MQDDELDTSDDDSNVDNTYLTFQVSNEEYAVPVAYVTEIVRLQKSFAIPDVPAYVRGVINLRGKVIPLLDVRSRFGLVDAVYTDRTVVVVLEVGESATGLVVDAVSEVAEILPVQIEERTRVASSSARPLVKGMGKREGNVSFIVDVHALLAIDESGNSATHALSSEIQN
jgi:purine-binding chemotaxis protein CheW